MDRPNILLLVVDCLRADHAGSGPARTPTMDAIIEQGFSFDAAITSTSTTTPSFASILTGLYPFENGVRSHTGYALARDVETLPGLLSAAGYRTYAEATGPLVEETGLDRGFDEYSYRPRESTIDTDWGEGLLARFEDHYREPWFVMLHLWALHEPRQVLPELDRPEYGRTLYARAVSSLDRRLGSLMSAVGPDAAVVLTGDHGEVFAASPLDAFRKRHGRGWFLFLQRLGLTRQHYSRGMRHLKVGHGINLYDELVRVPLVVRAPGAVLPGRSDVQVRQVDIAPTALELAGVEAPEGMTGRSLLPVARGEETAHREAYMEAVGVSLPREDMWTMGLRVAGRWKYIVSPFAEGHEELFDLEADPAETRNVASEHPELVARLRQRVQALGAETMRGEPIDEGTQEEMLERLRGLGYVD